MPTDPWDVYRDEDKQADPWDVYRDPVERPPLRQRFRSALEQHGPAQFPFYPVPVKKRQPLAGLTPPTEQEQETLGQAPPFLKKVAGISDQEYTKRLAEKIEVEQSLMNSFKELGESINLYGAISTKVGRGDSLNEEEKAFRLLAERRPEVIFEPLLNYLRPREQDSFTRNRIKELASLPLMSALWITKATAGRRPIESAKDFGDFIETMLLDMGKILTPATSPETEIERDQAIRSFKLTPIFHVAAMLPLLKVAGGARRMIKAEAIESARALAEAEYPLVKKAIPEGRLLDLRKAITPEEITELSTRIRPAKEPIRPEPVETPEIMVMPSPIKRILRGESGIVGFEVGMPVRVKGIGKFGGSIGRVRSVSKTGAVKIYIPRVGERVFGMEKLEPQQIKLPLPKEPRKVEPEPYDPGAAKKQVFDAIEEANQNLTGSKLKLKLKQVIKDNLLVDMDSLFATRKANAKALKAEGLTEAQTKALQRSIQQINEIIRVKLKEAKKSNVEFELGVQVIPGVREVFKGLKRAVRKIQARPLSTEEVGKMYQEMTGQTGPKGEITFDPQKASGYEGMLTKQRQSLHEQNKTTAKKIYNTVRRKIWDVAGGPKEALRKQGGPMGQRVIDRFEAVAGFNARAELMYSQSERSIGKGLSHRESQLLSDHLQAKRQVEIEQVFRERGQKPPKPPEGKGSDYAQAWINRVAVTEAPETVMRLNKASQGFWSSMDRQLKMLLDEGLIDTPQFEALQVYSHYAPKRYIQHLDPVKTYNVGGKRITNPESGIRALGEGSENFLFNDWRFLLNQTIARTQGRIMRNSANRTLYEFLSEKQDFTMARIQEARITKTGKRVFDPQPSGETAIDVLIDGRRQRMLLKNEFAKDWLLRDPEISHNLANTLRVISGSFILRPFATGAFNPAFAIANLPRDIALSWLRVPVFSPFAPHALFQYGKYIGRVSKDAWNRTGRYEDYIMEGGGMEFLTHQGRAFKGQTALNPSFRALRQGLESINAWSEVVVRLAIRERAIERGLSPQEATMMARRYLDFNQGGTIVKAADNMVPYLNAGVQATRSVITAARENPALFSAKMGQMMAIELGLYMWGRHHHQETLDQVSEKIKTNYWVIPTGMYRMDDQGRKRLRYFRIPKDQSMRVFTSLARALGEKAVEGKMPIKSVLEAAQDFLPLLPGKMSVPAAEAWYGYMTNTDFWTNDRVWKGADIEAWAEGINDPNVNKFFRDIGRLSKGTGEGLSPKRMQQAMSELFTYSSPYANLVGVGYNKLFDRLPEEEKKKAYDSLTQVPGISRILAETSPFVEGREEAQRVNRSERTRLHLQNSQLRKLQNEDVPALQIREFILKQPQQDRKRLVRRYRAMTTRRGLEGWWYDLLDAPNAYARATVFWMRWRGANSQGQKEMFKTARDLGGIYSEDFNKWFRYLSQYGEKGLTRLQEIE